MLEFDNLISKYQPIVDVWKNNLVIGYEATTANFMALSEIAQETNQLAILDYQARDTALSGLTSRLEPRERIFVNIFPDPDVVNQDWFSEEIDLSKVTLEITEQQVFPMSDEILLRLSSNRQKGMQVALDDFGVGHIGLRLVDLIEPDYIKLDKLFVETMRCEGKTAVIKGMIRFCEETRTRLIVEGIEYEEDYVQLVDLGVRYMQGFYFGRPMTAHQMKSR